MFSPTKNRKSFTLVELLVVITIIGVLSALIAGVAVSAIAKAKETKIKVELDMIAGAFKAYKQKYGSYPPNYSDAAAVTRHFKKAFPRHSDTPPVSLTPAQAIVYALRGYSPDPTSPLSMRTEEDTSDSTIPYANRTPLFDFDKSRIFRPGTNTVVDLYDDVNNAQLVPEYKPSGMTQPYVYFDTSRNYAPDATYPPTGTVKIRSYRVADGSFANSGSFQVLSAGLDDLWGVDLLDPTSTFFPIGPFTGDHADNLVSFSPKNLEDSQP